MSEHNNGFFHRLEFSAVITILGIVLLFSTAVGVIVIAPNFADPSWVQPTSHYQVQMYEVADPNFYVARASEESDTLDFVHHIQTGYTLVSFEENAVLRFVAPPDLEKYITRFEDKTVKLTSHLLLLRTPEDVTTGDFNPSKRRDELQAQLHTAWEKEHPDHKEKNLQRPDYLILEVYDPKKSDAFTVAFGDGTSESYIDANYKILDGEREQPYFKDPGVIYVKNPQEYRVTHYLKAGRKNHRYDPNGQPVKDLTELKSKELGFMSRKELITMGEYIYRIEGCWYCHTDQTRTLIQDTVLNGTESFAAPPSSANEYIYQYTTFPSTRRIGPDLSRVGVKRPSRDWNKSHFWAPKTSSAGSIMPSFRHFFDHDPRGTAPGQMGIPNHQFEAIYQYMMTKGTRITPPTQAWWTGKDPFQTTLVIEGEFGEPAVGR